MNAARFIEVNFSNLLIGLHTPLLEAMKIIDQGAVQVALVVDDSLTLLGTLTDGDIRRGLLLGLSLSSTADKVMNREFRSASHSESRQVIFELMRRESLRQLPIVDEEGRLVNLLCLDEMLQPPQVSNAVVIMAGGKGTRLRPFTENCPKPMLKIGDKPILEIILEKCVSSGFRDFYFSVNYLKEQIINYFEDGSRWDVSISYLLEDEPLGTAGSLNLMPKTLTKPFLVLNGDVLTRVNPLLLLEFHEQHEADATLCVREHEVNVPFGVVKTTGIELSDFEEKPVYSYLVNAGVYVIDPGLLQLVPRHMYLDMPTLLQKAQKHGFKVNVCPIHEYWVDVGRPETLQLANQTWHLPS